MQHSIKNIGKLYEALSFDKKDEFRFMSDDFFKFAQENQEKYSLVRNGDDFLVDSSFSIELIKGYGETMKPHES